MTQPLIRQGIVRLRKRLEEVNALDPSTIPEEHGNPALEGLRSAITETLVGIFGHGTPRYINYASAADFGTGWKFINQDPLPGEVRAEYEKCKQRSLALLNSAVRSLEEQVHEVPAPAVVSQASKALSNKVFVVHGHDEGAKQALARFLEKIELEAVILHEQPDQGRTIIEKFEACAGEVGFAVVLLTPDDIGSGKAAPAQARARQNVVFELGYFAGKLGRGKVCLMRKGDVEIPSDLYGVIYTELDANDGWKVKLVRELKAAKLTFDANKVWE